jgi:LPXTG-motif cell wall-anchored protein
MDAGASIVAGTTRSSRHVSRKGTMKQTLRRFVAIVTIVVAAVLALPVAAQASDIYPPSGSCTVSPSTIAPGGSVTFSCVAGTFSEDETVTITVTGENGAAASIGMLRFAITTASGTSMSAADGSLAAVSITLPASASGIYNIAAVSATSAGGTAAVTVTTGSGGLPSTGLDSGTTLGLWIGGAALVLVGGTLAVVAAVRRSRRG